MAAREPTPVAMPLWKAFAGPEAWVPLQGSRVFYFPEGHAEQCSSPPDLPDSGILSAYVCCVLDCALLADRESDEVFAKIVLDPTILPPRRRTYLEPEAEEESGGGEGGEGLQSFSRILSKADLNRIFVRMDLAKAFFPPLARKAGSKSPPKQTITARDVHGTVWKFQHVLNGTKLLMHRLISWSAFRNSKKIIKGDVLVFARDRGGEFAVGIRRTRCRSPSPDFSFVRPETVLKAVEKAESGETFEVLYFPGAGAPAFVVDEDVVLNATRPIMWAAGMRVKMAVASGYGSSWNWFTGTVSSVGGKDEISWPWSYWRLLQISWDQKDAPKSIEKVSPWQVELDDTDPDSHDSGPMNVGSSNTSSHSPSRDVHND